MPTREALKALSLELRELQRPLRILPALRWDADAEGTFPKASAFKKHVTAFYKDRPRVFQVERVREDLTQLRQKVDDELGRTDDAGAVLKNAITDFINVASLVDAVGTSSFGHFSRQLFGSAHDPLFSDGTTIYEYARRLKRTVKLLVSTQPRSTQKVIPAAAVAELMRARFRDAHLLEYIDVEVTSDIGANACASHGKIKIRADALFSAKDVDVLIYHEAYTHVATSLNGANQPFAKFLSFMSPRCTSTQEGLAVLMEIFSLSIYPQRLKKIADRVIAVGMAEEGADPYAIFDYYIQEKYSEREAYQLMSRVFRGTDLSTGQAFTKDVSYLKGLIECFNFIQYCLVSNQGDAIPFLFAGKLNVNEIPRLVRAYDAKQVVRPKWVPAPFQDLDALSSWFICTSALGQLGDVSYHERFAKAFRAEKMNPRDIGRLGLRTAPEV